MFNLFRKAPIMYGKKDLRLVEDYIRRYIGDFDEVFHELESPDIHVDVITIEPTPERDYYTLVTMGMGAYRMNVGPEYAKTRLNRAELAMLLPKEWFVRSNDERWFWPMRVLKILARMPIAEKSWLGYRHTVDYGQPVSFKAAFTGFILDFLFHGDEPTLALSGGDQLEIYHVVPIFAEEMDFMSAHSAKALYEALGPDVLRNPVDVRRNVKTTR